MRRMSVCLMATLGALPCGCRPSEPEYDYFTLREPTNPPGPAVVTPREIELVEDTAAAFKSWPVSGNEIEYGGPEDFDIRSRDESVMAVYPASDDYQWVVHGVRPGETCIEVVVRDVVEDCIPAQTTAQP